MILWAAPHASFDVMEHGIRTRSTGADAMPAHAAGSRFHPETYRRYFDLITALVAKDLKVRYRSAVLGYAWSLLNPLAFALVFYLVFKVFVRVDVENYTLYLFSGLFPWQWIANSAGAATGTFVGNSSLIKKVKFPRVLLVVAAVLNDAVHYLLTIPVFVLFALWYHKYPSVSWLYQIPVLTLVTFLITIGLALVISTCNVFLRDIERLVGIFMTFWFYMTPVLYKPDMIPERFRWVLYANPLASCIVAWRGVLLDNQWPRGMVLAAFLWGIVLALAGYRLYRKAEWRFAELV